MYNLENAIRDWKSRISRKGVDSENVNELESHLRDTIDELVGTGLSEEEAFSNAIGRLGKESELASEYRKVEKTLLVDRIAISAIGVTALFLSVQILWLLVERGRAIHLDTLLQINVGTLTIALMGSAFLFFLGVYCLLRQFFTRKRDRALSQLIRKVLVFGAPIGTGLALFGMATGYLWSDEIRHQPGFLLMKEIGAATIVLWYIGVFVAARRGSFSLPRLTMLILTGGLLVHFNWFVVNGMPFTTVSVMVALILAIVFVAALVAFRKQQSEAVLS